MLNGIRAALFSAGTLVAVTSPAMAWDYPGHRIVGAIADSVLQQHYPKTHQRVSELLDKKDANGNVIHRSLSEVAIFPDCAKDGNDSPSFCNRPPSDEEKAYTGRNTQHKEFHYTDVPIEQNTYKPGTAGTSEIDVVHMLDYAVAQLRGKNPAAKPHVGLTDGEAVWLIAHLVGDIHQPLHVGAKYYLKKKNCTLPVNPNKVGVPPEFGIGDTIAGTTGGLRIGLTAPAPAVPPDENLHYYWDGATVRQAMLAAGIGQQEQEFAKQLAATPPAGWETKGGVETWPTQWATENLALAAKAHNLLTIKKKPGTSCSWQATIDKSYHEWAGKQATVQIAKAGFRLAALLKAIYEPQ
jgi:hypothetical protein